jgi:FkbM family methyltransferase
LETRTYEPRLVALLTKVIRPGDVFVDIGANEGFFTTIAASLGAVVHAIEPQARLGETIRANLRENRCEELVRVHQVCLTDRPGQVSLFLRPSTNTGASSLFRYWRIGWKTESVESMTLDQFWCQENLGGARLVKIDCEGAESLILRRADRILSARLIDFLAIEYHPRICGAPACAKIHEKLRRASYTVTQHEWSCVYRSPRAEDPPREFAGLLVDEIELQA